jgi:uncharacterized protein YgbK (DUF1537 family)
LPAAKLAILADDFTGACDAAAPFAAAGRATRVLLQVPAAWPDGVDVMSVDLDVRSATAERARERMRLAAQRLGRPMYVKIDSTLRGPVAALIEGALDGSGLERAVVAPAFPEQGRIYHHGQLGATSLFEVLGPLAARCDIEDDVAAAAQRTNALLVGSGGLARRLAGASTTQLPRATGEVLVVAGSPAPETLRQLEHLPPTVEVLRTAATDQRDAGEAARQLAQAVAVRPELPGLLVLTGGETARRVAQALQASGVDLLGEVLPGMPVGRLIPHGTLVVTKAGGFGGPTAILDALRLLGPSCQHTP